ncbi:MAG: molybdenum cofactor biosynthesis protein [Thermoplasmata archaeon]|uniref:Molybdenum cofactor biosynthesis protein n=1 Tax=Candidatus Aciduliprofundum boonei TaxID=379547 RepID=A0A7J3T9H9_9ARCH|nr:molybdenum cofactor biosynthesis protein [Thermoplasmata archaeon]HHE75591.1 molybdenum cofactor biosynthesis protein [Candidatus Aciduliprofundum boonei]
MRPFTNLIPFEEAKRILMENVKPIERVEEIDILHSLHRVLAEDVISPINVPPFSRAAEDGYAVRAQDTFGAGTYNPKELIIVEEINTGEFKEIEIKNGECVKISTGAILPKNADAVVRVEDTEEENGKIKVYRAVHPGFDVAPRGEDIKKGEKILEMGTFLTPPKIGSLAAIGISKVKVYSRPKVAILPSGDELQKPGEQLKPGKIYDVNTYTISSIVKENGGEPVLFSYVRDEKKDIERKLKEALKYDVVVFSGGSSVGDRDILIDVVSKYAKVLFHGVQIKPGKPTWCAVGEKLIFGMPGFPTSCLSDSYQFLAPAIRKMARLPPKEEKIVKAKMARRITSTLGRMQFFTVRIKDGYAYPVYKTSGAITSMAYSDGYIIIPANVDLVEKDEEVEVHLWSFEG